LEHVVAAIRADGIAVYVYRRTPLLEFLQIRRSGSTNEYQRTWQTVYGGVEPGETAVQAALRELKEETGLTPLLMWQVEYLETFFFMPRDYVAVMPVFAVEVSADAAIALNDEHTEWRWVPEARLDNAFMWRSQREALQCLLQDLRGNSQAMGFLTVKLP
jgi:dihydroneopterin triphosphate diphosphatase